LLVVGKSIQCKKAAEIIDQINDVVQDWQTFANEVSVKPALRDAIAKTLININ